MELEHCSHQVEEVSRAYAQRNGIRRDGSWFMLKLHEEVGELTQAYLMKVGQARDKGLTSAQIDNNFAAELADVLGQVLLLARHHGVDLESAITSKWLAWLPASSSDKDPVLPAGSPSR